MAKPKQLFVSWEAEFAPDPDVTRKALERTDAVLSRYGAPPACDGPPPPSSAAPSKVRQRRTKAKRGSGAA